MPTNASMPPLTQPNTVIDIQENLTSLGLQRDNIINAPVNFAFTVNIL